MTTRQLNDNDSPAAVSGTAPAAGKDYDPEGGQALYLRLMTQRLIGWDDPRAVLQRALDTDQFMLLAQKVLAVKSGASEPQCYEVLLRLKQEEDNLLPPGGFLDVAESVGMMEEIDRWVLRTLLSWGASRLKFNPAWRPPMMCVNVSTAALDNPVFTNLVRDELSHSGFPPRALCFEIDERDIIEHHGSVQRFVAAVKPGCRIMVDGVVVWGIVNGPT